MTARFYWMDGQQKPPALAVRRRPQWSANPGINRGWPILGAITLVFGLWLAFRWLGQPDWLATKPAILREAISLGEAGMAFALGLAWFGLLMRSRQPVTETSGPADVDALYELSPEEFEAYVAGLFRHKGYTVTLRGGTGDHGVDLELTSPVGKRGIVQCKRYQSTVGEKVVRELFGTMIHERAAHAFLVTTAEISDAAHEWSWDKPMTLIDGQDLVKIARALSK